MRRCEFRRLRSTYAVAATLWKVETTVSNA
jgi:hypothetical protein